MSSILLKTPITLEELSKFSHVNVRKRYSWGYGFKNGQPVSTPLYLTRIYFITNKKKIDVKSYDENNQKTAERKETLEQCLREINNLIENDYEAEVTAFYFDNKLKGHRSHVPSKIRVNVRKMF